MISPLLVVSEGLLSTRSLTRASNGWLGFLTTITGWQEVVRFTLRMVRDIRFTLER
jgi:hypothetical protein